MPYPGADADVDDDPDDDDDCSSIFPCVGVEVGVRAVEGNKRKGDDPGRDMGRSGKVCRAQHFRLHEPVVEHHLATANDNDADVLWWSGVEEAIKCDEVVLAGKRHCEQEPRRAGHSKRPRKPG